jgi:hypothetical protein
MKKSPKSDCKSLRPLRSDELRKITGGGRKASDAYFVRVDSETTSG